MSAIEDLFKGFGPGWFPDGEKRYFVWFASIVVIVTSAALTILLGPRVYIIFGLLILIFLAIRYDKFLTYFFLAVAPITTFMYWNYKTYLNYSIVGGAIILWFIRKLIRSNPKINLSPQLIGFMIAFIFFASLSAINGGITRGEIQALIRFFIFFSYVIVLYDIFEIKDTLWLMAAIAAPLLLELYYVLMNFANTDGLAGLIMLYRLKPTGFFDNANNYGEVLICIIPFWAALAIWLENRKLRRLCRIILAVLIFALLTTNARAAFFGLVVAAILLSYWAKKLKYAVIVLSIAAILFFSLPTLSTLINLAFRSEYGTTKRTEIWANTFTMITKHPWLGVGVGNYSHEYMQYFPTVGMRNFYKALSHAHNQILSKTADLGLPGFFLMIALYFLPLRAGLKALKKVPPGNYRIYLYGIIGGIIAQYGRTLFETGMIDEGSFYPNIMFWTLFVMALKFYWSFVINPPGILAKHAEP